MIIRVWQQDDLSGVPFDVHIGVALQVTGLTHWCWARRSFEITIELSDDLIDGLGHVK